MDEQSSSRGSGSASGGVNSDVGSKPKQELNEEALKHFTTSATSSSSWTILPADRIEVLDSPSGSDVSSSSIETKAIGSEEEDASRESANERCKPVEDADPQGEDFSDGISIISDCESTGRLTPNPMFRGLLNDLNGNFELRPELPGTTTTPLNLQGIQQLRTRRRNEMEQLEQVEQLEDAPDGEKQGSAAMARPGGSVLSSQPSVVGYRLPALVQNGLTAVFYVGATLAILAFIGRIKNPEWQVLGGNKPSEELEQRLIDLELQNNLMRAEIDIMSKQLNYLSGQGQTRGSSPAQPQGRKAKTFKAWPGNGNSVDPVDITKQDLKRPYKCPDGQFVEIAGMCMESKPHAESLVDEIGNVVNDVLQQSQTFHNFEKITEKLGTLAGNGEQADEPTQAFHASSSQYKQRPESSKERYPSKQNNHKCKDPTRFKCNENESNEHGSKERNRFPKDGHNSKERTRTRNNERESNEHSKERTRSKSNEWDSNEHDSNEHDSNEHSKERTRSKSNEYDSKERHHKKYSDKSKERYGKQQQYRKQKDDSGEWHERMMQQRENARQRNEQKRNNNWYIERGGSREQRRSGETRR